MKIHLKRFLCAAMVAASSVFVGSVANAQQVNASLVIPPFSAFVSIPKNTECVLDVEGCKIPVKVIKSDYNAVISKPAPIPSEKEALERATRKHRASVPSKGPRLIENYSVVLEFGDEYLELCKKYASDVELKQKGKGLGDPVRTDRRLEGTLILSDDSEILCVVDLLPLFGQN